MAATDSKICEVWAYTVACRATARETEALASLTHERALVFLKDFDDSFLVDSFERLGRSDEDDEVSSTYFPHSASLSSMSSRGSSPPKHEVPRKRLPEEKWTKYPAAGLGCGLSAPTTWSSTEATVQRPASWNSGSHSSSWSSNSQLADGWLDFSAPDVWPIYVNRALGTTSWTRPEQPQSFQQSTLATTTATTHFNHPPPPPPPLAPSLSSSLFDMALRTDESKTQTERYSGRVVNVQSHYAFVRTEPPILTNREASVTKGGKHAKRVGDIFVYRQDVDFDLKARQQVTFQLAEYKGRMKAVHVVLDVDILSTTP